MCPLGRPQWPDAISSQLSDNIFTLSISVEIERDLISRYLMKQRLPCRPGGEGGNRPPKAKFMAHDGLCQFWGIDFEILGLSLVIILKSRFRLEYQFSS